MSPLYPLSIWLHLVAAATWVGSMVFFSAVAVPVLRHADVRGAAPRLVQLLGTRFRVLGWVALAVLVVTGVANLDFRGIGWSVLGDRVFWASPFGLALGRKLALVTLVLFATAAHEVVTGRSARSASARDGQKTRRRASWLGRFTLVTSLAILYFAAALVRGF